MPIGFQPQLVFSSGVFSCGVLTGYFPISMLALLIRRVGTSRLKSFWYGQLSGIVEPIAGVIGAVAVIVAQPILSYSLAFVAGAMIFVVIEDVVPESQSRGNMDLATMGSMVGFAIMMILDVAFSSRSGGNEP